MKDPLQEELKDAITDCVLSGIQHIETVKKLINRGAKISPEMDTSWDLFIFALHNNCNDFAVFLIDNGLGVNSIRKSTQQSPLHLAANAGNAEVVTALVSRGANIKALAKKKTAAEIAQKAGFKDIVAILTPTEGPAPTVPQGLSRPGK